MKFDITDENESKLYDSVYVKIWKIQAIPQSQKVDRQSPGDMGSGEWWEGRITKGLEETLGGDGYVIHHIVMVVVTVVVTVSQVVVWLW